MSMTASCGSGQNNPGSPLDDDLAWLDGIHSLTIKEVRRRTGLSRSRIYRYLDAKRLRSFKADKARLILAQSLRQLLGELAASEDDAPRYRHAGGRFAPPSNENTTSEDSSTL